MSLLSAEQRRESMIRKMEPVASTSIDFNLYDSIAVLITVLEPNQNNELVYVACNKTAYRVLDWTPEEVLGKTIEQIFPGPVGQIASKYQRDAFREKEPKTFDVRAPDEKGFRYRRTTLIPTLNERGNVIRIVATTLDVTAEKEAIEQRAISEQMVSEIENFTALAAHDLRTPMIHIASITEMIKRDVSGLDSKQLMAVNLLEGLAERAMALIKRVLERYRSVHAAHAEKQEFDLAALCMELYSVLDPFGHHRLIVQEQWVFADKVGIQVVMGNLIDNALKHNAGGSIEVFVSARQAADPGVFEVMLGDTGKGFDTRVRENLEDGVLKSSEHFGLAGIRRLIVSRGGSIVVTNTESGGGAVVRFTFPGRLARQN